MLLGIGSGMVVSPSFEKDIPGLVKLNAILVSVPGFLSFLIFIPYQLFCCRNGDEQQEQEQEHYLSYHLLSHQQESLISEGAFSVPEDSHPVGTKKKRGENFNGELENHENVNLSEECDNTYMEEVVSISVEEYENSSDLEMHMLMLQHSRSFSEASISGPAYVPLSAYFGSQLDALKNLEFVRLLVAIGLLTGSMNAWLTLSEQTAPPSLASPKARTTIALVYFGCGTVGAVLQGIIMNHLQDHLLLAKMLLGISSPFILAAAIGWAYDNQYAVYAGLGLSAFSSFGIISLCVEFGIEITFKPGMNLGGTVGGVVQLAGNVIGAAIIIIATPGIMPLLAPTETPIFLLTLMTIGGLLLTLTINPVYRRQTFERLNSEISDALSVAYT